MSLFHLLETAAQRRRYGNLGRKESTYTRTSSESCSVPMEGRVRRSFFFGGILIFVQVEIFQNGLVQVEKPEMSCQLAKCVSDTEWLHKRFNAYFAELSTTVTFPPSLNIVPIRMNFAK